MSPPQSGAALHFQRLLFCALALAVLLPQQANAQHENDADERIETIVASTVATVVGASSEQCTASDCNERGTCFGTKAMPLCLCQLGFAGARCQDTFCNPQEACSGHGWCMGTSSQHTCFCNLGYTGAQCERETIGGGVTPLTPPPPTGVTRPTAEPNEAEKRAAATKALHDAVRHRHAKEEVDEIMDETEGDGGARMASMEFVHGRQATSSGPSSQGHRNPHHHQEVERRRR